MKIISLNRKRIGTFLKGKGDYKYTVHYTINDVLNKPEREREEINYASVVYMQKRFL